MRIYGEDWVTDAVVDLREAVVFCTAEELEAIENYLWGVQRYLSEADAEGYEAAPQHFFHYWKGFQEGKDTDLEICRTKSSQSEEE